MSNPLLDVSELLDDPLFVGTITVLRRREVLVKGRSTFPVVETFRDVLASVQPKDTAIGGNVMERAPDYQLRGSNFNVYTKFRLSSIAKRLIAGTGVEYAPDIVMFNGDPFVVALTNDFSRYGAGFMHAEIVATSSVDNAPDGIPSEGCYL